MRLFESQMEIFRTFRGGRKSKAVLLDNPAVLPPPVVSPIFLLSGGGGVELQTAISARN